MSRLKIIALSAIVLLLCTGMPSVAQTDKNHFEVSKNIDILNAIVKETEMFYVDSINVEKMVRRGIDAMLQGLDPYTEYFPEQDVSNLKFITTGEYGGIGSYIRERKGGGVYIVEPFAGMPAAEAGLKAGDRILAVDDVDVTKKSSDEVSSLLKGVPNTKMTLKIQRPNEKKPRTFSLIRRQILENQVTYYGVRGNNTGYIYLKGFTDKSAQEVKSAFEDLKNNQHIKSLIIDLRNNGGGVLESAVQIVGMFVPKGSLVLTTKGKVSQRDRTYRTPVEPLDTVMPIAVLINSSSASASEILSGSLQDMDRAVLVGERSYGKGLVQAPRDLPYNGTLKVTTSRYYIPSGRCIQQLDYTHRKADGSVDVIPDSLTSVFYTAHHRPVRDGGGVRPEFEVEEPESATMLYYLATDFVLIDFVTDWCQKHETIAPVEQFEVTDEDFEAFKKYALDHNFTYDRQSEKLLKNLKEVAQFEGFSDADTTIFDELQAKLTPNLVRDFDANKSLVKRLLASEIVKRYYYQRGELIESLKDDKVLEKAIQVLNDTALYKKTLDTPVQSEAKK